MLFSSVSPVIQPAKKRLLNKNDDLTIHKTIVNPHNFKYIFNPGHRICGNRTEQNVTVLVYVHTSPSYFARRQAIRETWAKRSMFRDIRLVFMMGATPEKKTNNLLKLESNYFNDIVQEDFHDSYKNLTYKGIMAMKWISEYCAHTQFILKTDDDIIIDMFKFLRHVDKLNMSKPKKMMYCHYYSMNGMPVMREKSNKWYLSKEYFEFDYFGEYCSGSAFFLTADLAPLLFNVSKYIKFVWVDDYYVTGLMLRGAGGNYSQSRSIYTINANIVHTRFMSGKAPMIGHFGHKNTVNRMYDLWENVLRSQLFTHEYLNIMPYQLIKKMDFGKFDFKWTMDIWKPFYGLKLSYNESESFNYGDY